MVVDVVYLLDYNDLVWLVLVGFQCYFDPGIQRPGSIFYQRSDHITLKVPFC